MAYQFEIANYKLKSNTGGGNENLFAFPQLGLASSNEAFQMLPVIRQKPVTGLRRDLDRLLDILYR